MRQYGMSGTIYGIVSLLAESAATPPWKLYKKPPQDGRVRYTTGDKGSDQRTQVVQHAAIQLWNNPNSWHSGFEFREGSNQHEELTGETFWILDTEAGFPTSMWYVRPDRMEPVPDPDRFLVGWIYTGPDGTQVPLKDSEVILEKRPSPLDPYRGAGPVASILPNIQQQRYATEYQRNLFLNGADPGGVITVPNRLTEPQFDELINRWRESHRGVARAGQVGVLEDGMTWEPNAHTNKDMEYGQLRLANRDELREAWRIHKAMMGSSDDVNRANAQTAEETFVDWQMLPRLNRRRDTLNSKLLPLFGGADKTVEFDYDDPSKTNAEGAAAELLSKSQSAAALVAAGYDPHDVLETVGLPDMDFAEPATPPPPALPTGPAALPGVPNAEAEAQNRRRETITMTRARAAAKTAPDHDLDQVDAQWKAAVAALVAAYLAQILPAQRQQLLDQIQALVDAGNTEDLTSLDVDSTDGAALILAAMAAMAAKAASQASREARAQGVPGVQPKTPDRDGLAAAAAVVAALLAMGLALAAGAEAFRRAGAGDNIDGVAVADDVEGFLADLSDATLVSRLGGALSSAQNAARIATILDSGLTADLYASEVNDKNTCSNCRAVDGEYIGNTTDPGIVTAVAALYPNGGYIDCAGGDRCRGTVFADWAATGTQDRMHAQNDRADAATLTGLVHRVLSDGYVPIQLAGRK
jgi:HK97 family phage portal protein